MFIKIFIHIFFFKIYVSVHIFIYADYIVNEQSLYLTRNAHTPYLYDCTVKVLLFLT